MRKQRTNMLNWPNWIVELDRLEKEIEILRHIDTDVAIARRRHLQERHRRIYDANIPL